MRNRVTQQSVFVENTLPALDPKDVAEAAGLEFDLLSDDNKRDHCYMNWQYSGGIDREDVSLNPGERANLPMSVAAAMVKQLGDRGLITYPLDADEAALKKMRRDALNKSIKFWQDRGDPRIRDYQRTHGIDKSDLEYEKHGALAYYYLAAARAKLLQGHFSASVKAGSAKSKTNLGSA